MSLTSQIRRPYLPDLEKENQFDELRAQLKQLEPLEKPLPEILIQLAGLVPAFNIFTEYLEIGRAHV